MPRRQLGHCSSCDLDSSDPAPALRTPSRDLGIGATLPSPSIEASRIQHDERVLSPGPGRLVEARRRRWRRRTESIRSLTAASPSGRTGDPSTPEGVFRFATLHRLAHEVPAPEASFTHVPTVARSSSHSGGAWRSKAPSSFTPLESSLRFRSLATPVSVARARVGRRPGSSCRRFGSWKRSVLESTAPPSRPLTSRASATELVSGVRSVTAPHSYCSGVPGRLECVSRRTLAPSTRDLSIPFSFSSRRDVTVGSIPIARRSLAVEARSARMPGGTLYSPPSRGASHRPPRRGGAAFGGSRYGTVSLLLFRSRRGGIQSLSRPSGT